MENLEFTILEKKILAPQIVKFKVRSNLIPINAKPGQFIVVLQDLDSERIPLTLFNWDKKENYIEFIFQIIGAQTYKLSQLKEGDTIHSILGPLGKVILDEDFNRGLFIGGGLAQCEIYPKLKYYKSKKKKIYTLIGAKTKELIFLEKELREFSDKIFIYTDDGSYQKKGFLTQDLDKILLEEKIDFVYCAGPAIMLKKVSEITKSFNIKTIASLNPIMVDATGLCGACRVIIDGKEKFVCVDGPEFEVHKVNFDSLIERLSHYKDKEECACKFLKENLKKE